MPRHRLVDHPVRPALADPYGWGDRPALAIYLIRVMPPRGQMVACGYSLTPPPDDAVLTFEADRYNEPRRVVRPAHCTIEVESLLVTKMDVPLDLLDRTFHPMPWLLDARAS